MSPRDKKATATKATNNPSPPTRRTPIPARSPIDDGTRTQLVTLPSQRRRSGSPLLAGLPDRTPKKRKGKAKESPVSTIESATASSISDLGSRLEHAVDDRHQLTRFSKTPLKEHLEQRGDKGPSSTETGKGGDKGPSSVRKGNDVSASGIESAKGSSPADFASSGVYAGKSPRGSTNWGDLEDGIFEKDSEEVNTFTNIAEIYQYCCGDGKRPDYQKDSDFPHAGVMPPKKDKEDPKESDEDSGVSTDEDEDKPQDGKESPGYDPDPFGFPDSTYKLKKEFDKALQVRKRILNDKSLSEEVRIVHLRKSKMLIEAMTEEIVKRDAALVLPGETSVSSAAAPAPAPTTLSDEDEYLQCIAKGKAIQERIAAREKAAKTQASSSNTDEDWTSLSATFDRATSKPSAFQGIVNRLDENAVLEQPVVRRTVDVASDKGQWEGFLAGAALQSATPASSRVRERNSSPQHIRENSPGKGARPSSPTEVAEPNQDRDMRAQESSSAAAEDLPKSDGEYESASEEFDENLFMENLDKLAASGDLDTVEGVKQAFINAFGEEMSDCLRPEILFSTLFIISYYSVLILSIALSRITKTSKTK